ncbi:unnamed protein product [Ceratitis capitata]|uniref:(Mediterranean fruit fly) hypothetical protein n=1 Tax=Ceratitis capitata TaxID=7213 RepID=A0A811USZ0_CERCA|nr:unnamed protein product [Ceratitis capitata]
MAELEIFCAKWSTDLASDQTETLLNVKLQQLDKNWDSLLEAYEAIFMADAYPEVSESVEQKYAKCSESFQNCKAQMLEQHLYPPKQPIKYRIQPRTKALMKYFSRYQNVIQKYITVVTKTGRHSVTCLRQSI